jgi:hypothetical protein
LQYDFSGMLTGIADAGQVEIREKTFVKIEAALRGAIQLVGAVSTDSNKVTVVTGPAKTPPATAS